MRKRVNRTSSRSEFNSRESRTHKKNKAMSFRGGIRL